MKVLNDYTTLNESKPNVAQTLPWCMVVMGAYFLQCHIYSVCVHVSSKISH